MESSEQPKPREASANRRQSLRVEVALAVTFAIAGEAATSSCRAVTRDISHGGACLVVSNCPEELPGRLAGLPLLDLGIDLVSALPLRGRVEWVRPPAGPGGPLLLGLAFKNLCVADEVAIIDLIAHILIGRDAARQPDPSRADEPQPVLSA